MPDLFDEAASDGKWKAPENESKGDLFDQAESEWKAKQKAPESAQPDATHEALKKKGLLDFLVDAFSGAGGAGLGGVGWTPRTEEEQRRFVEGQNQLIPETVRYGAPAVGIAAGGPVAGGLLGGAGETAAQLIEMAQGRRSKFSPGDVAFNTAANLVPGAGEGATTIPRFIAGTTARGAVRGAAGQLAKEATEAATGERPLFNENGLDTHAVMESAGRILGSSALGAGIEGAGSTLAKAGQATGRGLLDATAGEAASKGFFKDWLARSSSEFQKPQIVNKIQANAQSIRDYADSPESHDEIARIAGPIAQAYKLDPANLESSIAKAIRSAPDGNVISAVKDEIQNHVGQLDQRLADAVDSWSDRYRNQAIGSTATEVGQKVKALGQAEVADFRRLADEKYSPYRDSEEFNTPIDELGGGAAAGQPKKKTGNLATFEAPGGALGEEAERAPTINDLVDQRTKAMKKIAWMKQVQKADFDAFEHLDNIQERLDDALEKLPDSEMVKGYRELNSWYKNQISRFKGSYANQVLRNVGEEGGSESGVMGALLGSKGPDNLKALKGILGNRYAGAKDDIGQILYNQVFQNGDAEGIGALSKAMSRGAGGLQPEVVQEFFPGLTPAKLAEAKAAVTERDTAFANDMRKALTGRTELHNTDPEQLVRFLGNNAGYGPQVRQVLSPNVQEDARNFLLSQLLERSGGDADAFRRAASRSDAVRALFGEGADAKINGIAKALERAEEDATKSTITSRLLTGAAAGAAYLKMQHFGGSLPVSASSAVGQGYIADKLQRSIRNRLAAKVLDNPYVRELASKPYSELTQSQVQDLQRYIPLLTSQVVNHVSQKP